MGFSFCSFVHCRDLVRMTICWKASGAVWWNCSLGKFLEFSICSLRSRLRAPLRIFLRQTLCRIFGQTLGQKPSGPAAPRVFGRGSGLRCGFGFAFGKSFGVPSIYSLGNRLRTLGTSLGNSFTTLHPRLFNRLYQCADELFDLKGSGTISKLASKDKTKRGWKVIEYNAG